MKSILQNKKDRTCFLCMMLHGDDWPKPNLHEHHVIHGWANRRLSEKHGLKVYLCVQHPLEGSEAVHRNDGIDKMLQAYAQRRFEERWPEKDFRKIFGKNCILEASVAAEIEENQEKVNPVAGFEFISDGLEDTDGWIWD